MLRAVQQSDDLDRDRASLARGFQDAALEVLAKKTALAAEECDRPLIVLGGGVACNRALAAAVRTEAGETRRVAVASPRLNTDNAAMIGAAGSGHLARGERHGSDLDARDLFPLPGLGPATGVTP